MTRRNFTTAGEAAEAVSAVLEDDLAFQSDLEKTTRHDLEVALRTIAIAAFRSGTDRGLFKGSEQSGTAYDHGFAKGFEAGQKQATELVTAFVDSLSADGLVDVDRVEKLREEGT